MPPVVIACASDSHYTRPLAAMLTSVADNLEPGRTAEFHVIHSAISEAEREIVAQGLDRNRFAIHWMEVDERRFAELPLWGRMPVSTYFRIALADLLPAHVNRVIWLDCDLIVLGDVSRLWDIELDGKAIAAVQDSIVPLVSSPCGVAHHASLGIEPSAKYFNAGVMLIDVNAWRERDIARLASDYLRHFAESVMFWDQEALNVILAGNWQELDGGWNRNAGVPRSQRSKGGDLIVHFTGTIKPWRYRTSDPLRKLYYRYLDRTGYAGWRPERSLAGWLVAVYEGSRVRDLMYPAEKYWMRVVRHFSRTRAS